MWAPGSSASSATQTLTENSDASLLQAELATNISKRVLKYATRWREPKTDGKVFFPPLAPVSEVSFELALDGDSGATLVSSRRGWCRALTSFLGSETSLSAKMMAQVQLPLAIACDVVMSELSNWRAVTLVSLENTTASYLSCI